MKVFFTPYIYIVFFGLSFTAAYAQNWQLHITPADSISSKILQQISYKKIVLNETDLNKELDTVFYQLEQLGIWTPQLALLKKIDSSYFYTFASGPIYHELTLYVDENFPPPLQKSLNIDAKTRSLTVPIQHTAKIVNSIVAYLEANGFPFAEVALINQKIEKEQLSAHIQITYHQKRTIDKIVIESYPDFPVSFIRYQTPLKVGTTFQQQKLLRASDRITKLHFVSELKQAEVLFTPDSTIVYLYLNKKKAHQFDGLIGFNTSEKNSKLQLHGYIDISLNNSLNKGETLNVNWQNTAQDQTTFKLYSKIPFVFNSPISLEVLFKLHKQDSTYLTTSYGTKFLYQVNNHLIKTEWEQFSSNLLSAATNATALLTDFKKNYLGISYGYQQNKMDRFFPTELETQISTYTGNRTSLNTKSNQQKVRFLVNYTWELNSRNYMFIQNRSEKLIGNEFYLNELLLLGGVNSIRGFNENQLYSSSYSLFNLEYRYVTSNDSYLYTITDYAITKNKILDHKDYLTGLGLGYAFKINAAYLTISYSLGKFSDTSFDFNQSKIHLKWIQNF